MFERTIMRYMFVGAAAYLIEIGTLYCLHYIFRIDALWSVAMSFWVGFIVAYFLQKVITFQNRDYSKRTLARELVLYSALVAFNYLFTLIVVALLESSVSVIVLRTGIIIITTIWNFLIYRRLFAKRSME
jgi:putative flippase GtrA